MPVQNIIIEFTADASGLAPGVEGIQQLTKVDKEVAAAFDKTNSSLKQRQAIIEGNTAALGKFVQGIANSQKVAIGDNYSKVLQGIRTQLELTDAEAKAFYQNLIRESEAAIVDNKNIEQIEQLQQVLIAAKTSLDEFKESKPVEVRVDVNKSDLENIPLEIKSKAGDVEITPKVVFSDQEVQQAITRLSAELNSKDLNFDLLSKATAKAKEILPTLAQDSEAFKTLSVSVAEASVQLDKIIQGETNFTRIISQLKSTLQGGLGKFDFGQIDFSNIKGAKAQLDALADDALRLEAVLKQAGIAITQLNPASPQFKELDALLESGTVTLEQYNGALKQVGATQDSTGQKTVRATTLLREMRQELLVMEETGTTFSQRFGLSFDQLSIKAAKLQDNIGDTAARIQQLSSETFGLDAFVGALTGVAAGFNAAQGAALLFGGDQQEVQQALLKTMAAMQLLSGLQTIYNLLIDQSVVKTGLQALSQKIFGTAAAETAVAVGAETVALEGEVAALGEATVAQTALNVAMEANPIGLIIAAIALLAAGVGVFAIAINKAGDAQEDLNKTLEATAEAEKKAADGFAKEQASLNVLLATAKDETLTLKERQDAIDKITKQYPEYLHSLSLDNLYTSQSAGLIENQIRLLKERAFVQAAQDLYTEKLKKVAEAEANLNKIQTTGASYWEKLKGNLFNIGAALTGTSAQENALKEATQEINNANKDANISLGVLQKGIEDVSASMHGGTDASITYTNSLDDLVRSINGLPKEINVPTVVKPFDPAEFDEEKKKALEVAQYRIDVAKKGSKEEFDARRALAQLEFKQSKDDVRLNDTDRLNAEASFLKEIKQLDDEARAQYFRDTISNAKAIVLQQEALGVEGTEAFFNARRQVLIKTAQEAKTQEGITAGEIKLINVQLNLDLEALEIERKNKALEIQKSIIQDRLTVSKQGSQDELNQQIALLEIERQTEVNNAKGNAIDIAAINDKFRNDEFDKIKAFKQKVEEETINLSIAGTNDKILQLQLQGVADTDAKVLSLKKALIDEQAALEVVSISNTEHNEELRRARIQGVYDKALLDKKALEDNKNKAEIDAALKSQQELLDIQKQGLNALGGIVGAFGPARTKLNEQLFNNDLANIAAERAALEQSFRDKLISQDQYNQQSKQLDDALTTAEIENAQRSAQAKTASFDTFANAFQKGIDFAFDGEKQKLEQSAQDNQALMSAKLISQDEFNKRQKKLKQEEATIDKEKAIFDIIIDFAKQLFAIKAQAAALLSNPFTAAFAPVALAQIPLLIASEAISLGLVAAQKFKHGKVNIDGPGTTTSDSIHARISRGESVINAEATTGITEINTSSDKRISIRHEDVLTALNEHRFKDYVQKIVYAFDVPKENIEKMISATVERLINNNSISSFFESDTTVEKFITDNLERFISNSVNERFLSDIERTTNEVFKEKLETHETNNKQSIINKQSDTKHSEKITDNKEKATTQKDRNTIVVNNIESLVNNYVEKLLTEKYSAMTIVEKFISENKIATDRELRNEFTKDVIKETVQRIVNTASITKDNKLHTEVFTSQLSQAFEAKTTNLIDRLIPAMQMPAFYNLSYSLPHMASMPSWTEKFISKEYHSDKENTTTQPIDYSRMGKSIGKEINKRNIEIGFDEGGMYAFFKDRIQQEQYAEKRRRFRK